MHIAVARPNVGEVVAAACGQGAALGQPLTFAERDEVTWICID